MIRFNGKEDCGQHGQRAHDVVGAVAKRREVHLDGVFGRLLEPAHMREHTLDVFEHVARTHAQQLALAARAVVRGGGPFVEGVDPFLHCSQNPPAADAATP